MIYGVKIYDGEGNVKKVVEQKDAQKLYWSEFYLQGGDYHDRGIDVDAEMLEERGRKIICANVECKKEAIVMGKRTRFCSLECQTKRRRDNNNKYSKLKPQYETICEIKTCDNTFVTTGKQKFCSVPCRRLANIAKNRRHGEKSKATLAKIKLENAKREQEVFQR